MLGATPPSEQGTPDPVLRLWRPPHEAPPTMMLPDLHSLPRLRRLRSVLQPDTLSRRAASPQRYQAPSKACLRRNYLDTTPVLFGAKRGVFAGQRRSHRLLVDCLSLSPPPSTCVTEPLHWPHCLR